MSRRIPKPTNLVPWRGDRPLSRPEQFEARAVRLACVLTLGVLHTEIFTASYSPLPDDPDSRRAWLRRRLLSLAPYSRTIRAMCSTRSVVVEHGVINGS